MDAETAMQMFEKVAELPPRVLHDVDLTELAQCAALAYHYAVKVENGEAVWPDVPTLICHVKVLADDLHDLALALGM